MRIAPRGRNPSRQSVGLACEPYLPPSGAMESAAMIAPVFDPFMVLKCSWPPTVPFTTTAIRSIRLTRVVGSKYFLFGQKLENFPGCFGIRVLAPVFFRGQI